MDLQKTEGGVVVTLSERNLEDFVAQKAMGYGRPTLMRRTNAGLLVVYVQSNDEHYERRVAGPGSSLLDRKPSAESLENELLKLSKEELIDILTEQAKHLDDLHGRLDMLAEIEDGVL